MGNLPAIVSQDLDLMQFKVNRLKGFLQDDSKEFFPYCFEFQESGF
jgi:hypothetical protein